MRTLMVVKVEIALQGREQIEATGEVAGIDQFVFERAPQPFDENIVEGSATAIHADRNATLPERSQEFGGSELRALIGVPDFRLTEGEDCLEGYRQESSQSIYRALVVRIPARVAESCSSGCGV